ncbi:hypothetical protein GCM10009605_22370 [Nocardiopsis composta]
MAGGWTVRVRVFDTSGGRERVRDCGTGVVLPGAQILTSAHVLAGAAARGARVVVDAPGALRERAWTAEADVAEVFDEGPADFAVLRLPDAPPPPLHPPELRRCGEPAGREVAVSGYPGGGETELWAYCALRDRGGRPGGVQMEGQRTTAQRIVPGYSGAGVRDERTGAVVGIVTGAYDDPEARTAVMLPLEALLDVWAPLKAMLTLGEEERLDPAVGEEVCHDLREERWLARASGRRRMLAVVGMRLSRPLQTGRGADGRIDGEELHAWTSELVRECWKLPDGPFALWQALNLFAEGCRAERRLAALLFPHQSHGLEVQRQEELRTRLSGLSVPRLRAVFRTAAPHWATLDRDAALEDAWDGFCRLSDAPAERDVPPRLVFADLLRHELGAARPPDARDAPAAAALADWVGAEADRLERDGARGVRAYLQERRRALQEYRADTPCYLILQVERVHDDLADPRRGLRVWRQTDPGEWRPHPVGRDKVVHVDRLGHRAVQAVLDAERGWAHDLGSELLIEVALPLDLLALEVEAWPYPLLGSGFIVELGDHYRMVLRGLEEQMAPVYHRRLRWGALKSGGRPRVHWVDGEGSRNGALQHRMREDRRSVVAVLEPGAADPLGEKGMYYALAHGFPFLLWDRRGRLDRSFCDRLEQALGEEEDARTAALRVHGAVDRLRRPPGGAQGGRSEHGPVERRFAVLHDDPDRPLRRFAPAGEPPERL